MPVRPGWRLSCYGPVGGVASLFGVPENIEMSFEEARLAYYTASKQPGGLQQHVSKHKRESGIG
jgi:hypothetical protein